MEQSSRLPVEPLIIIEEDVSLRTLKLKKVFSQLMRFGITGGCNAAIDIFILNLLLWRFPTDNPNIIIVYNTAAYALGAANSYLLNKYWTFRRRDKVTGTELLRFIMVNVAGILSNDFIFWLAASLLHPSFANLILLTNASKVTAILGTACISYFGMRLWVFKGASYGRKNEQEGHILAMINTQGEGAPDAAHGAVSLTNRQPQTFLTTRSLSVILPAHNEEGVIATTVYSMIEALLPWVPDFEIIVVNDGSQDNTQAIVEAIARSDSHVRLITHEVNQGYGATLVTGFEAVTKDLAFFTDSDGQFDPHDLAPFFPLIEQYDTVLGYRVNRQDTWLRKLNAWGWHFLVTTIFGVHVRDVDCAFKLYRANFFSQNPLETRGAMINAEILYKLKRAGCTMTEVGVHHLPRTTGKATGAKPAVILRALREMFYYARKWRREEQQKRAVTSVV